MICVKAGLVQIIWHNKLVFFSRQALKNPRNNVANTKLIFKGLDQLSISFTTNSIPIIYE